MAHGRLLCLEAIVIGALKIAVPNPPSRHYIPDSSIGWVGLSGAEIAAIEGQLKGYFCPGSNPTAQLICCARGGSCNGSRLWPERAAALLSRTVYGTASLQEVKATVRAMRPSNSNRP